MKKLLLLLTFLVTTVGLLSAENKADFNTMNNGEAQSSISYTTLKSTDGWVAEHCGLISPTKATGELAPTLNGKTSAVGKVTSPTLSGGVGTVSFDYTNTYKESYGVKLSISILQNGEVVKSETLTNTSVTQSEKYTFTTQEFNVEGDFQIEVKNLSPSNSTSNKDRVSIWNLTWTNYVDTTVKTLGDIVATYGEGNTSIANDDVLEGIKVGTVFNFSAENATSLVVKDSNTTTIASGTDSATWTATETEGEELTVTATLGEEIKTLKFMVEVVPDEPVKTLGDIVVIYNETPIENESTVDFPLNAEVSVSSVEAQKIIYELYDEAYNMVKDEIITTDTGKIVFDKPGTFTVMIFSYLDANQTEGFDETNSKSFLFTANVSKPDLGEIVATYGEENTPIAVNDEITVEIGTTFTFSATNATNIKVETLMGGETVVNENSDKVTWTVNNPFEQDGVTVTATNGYEPTTFEFFLTVTEPIQSVVEYAKVSSMDEFVAGKKYILVGASKNAAKVGIMGAGANSNKYRTAEDVTDSNATTIHDSYVITDKMDVCPFVIEEHDGAYALRLENGKYIAVKSYSTASSVDLQETDLGTTSDSKDLTKFTVSIDDKGEATIENGNLLSFNSGANPTRFKSYAKKQSPVYLYKLVEPKLEVPTFSMNEGATEVSIVSTKGDLHVWTLEYDKDNTLVKDNGVDVPASVMAKAPAADDKTWLYKVAEENEEYKIAFPTTEGNYMTIRAKSVLNGVHSEELVKIVDSNGNVLSGVEAVMTDDVNAPVEYFNLQGVRVNADQPGLYIRRQGNKAEKVTIR